MSRNKKIGTLICVLVGITIVFCLVFKTHTNIYLDKTNISLYVGEKSKLELKNTKNKP